MDRPNGSSSNGSSPPGTRPALESSWESSRGGSGVGRTGSVGPGGRGLQPVGGQSTNVGGSGGGSPGSWATHSSAGQAQGGGQAHSAAGTPQGSGASQPTANGTGLPPGGSGFGGGSAQRGGAQGGQPLGGAPPGALAPATTLAGTAVTISGAGTGWGAGSAVHNGSAVGGPSYGAAPWQGTATGGGQRTEGMSTGGGLPRPPGTSPAATQVGIANPRADAAAQSLAQGNGFTAAKSMPASAEQTPAAVKAAQAAQSAQATTVAAAPQTEGRKQITAQPRTEAREGAAPSGSMAGRAGAQAAVAQAQAALAQALGRTLAGQMTAGAAAVALAQAQWALRAARLGESPAGGFAGTARPGAGATARGPELAPRGVRPNGLALEPRGRAEEPLAAATGADANGSVATGAAAVREERGPGKPLLAGEPTEMPHALAIALALAPKVRQRVSQDRVERVERDMPRNAAPELEDEDFWDAWSDADEDAQEEPCEAPGLEDMSREAAAQHYRALRVWLEANAQQALLRELEAGRCVLVLAPPDVSHMRLWGHVLRPDAVLAGRAAGAAGQAWPQVARWTATMPADTQWRVWRLRQDVDAAGQWRLRASRPDRHTPQLVVHSAADEAEATGPGAPERIGLQEPRRLRRLLGTQWTLMALRVPVPLDGTGLGAMHAVHAG